jgi:hypothetical protein
MLYRRHAWQHPHRVCARCALPEIARVQQPEAGREPPHRLPEQADFIRPPAGSLAAGPAAMRR